MKKDIKKIKLRYSSKIELDLFELESLFSDYSTKITLPHRPNFYQIYLFEDCTPQLTIDENTILIKPYSLLFVPENTVLQFDNDSTYKGKVLTFSGSFFYKSESDKHFLQRTNLFNDHPSYTLIESSESFNSFYENILLIQSELAISVDHYSFEILHNLLHNILLIAERQINQKEKKKISQGTDLDFAIRFKELIDKNYHSMKMVHFYLSELSISEKRLNQATTNTFSKTPKEMINDRIIQEAKRLLSFTNKSIKEIGVALNFEDPAYFIKYFKKQTQKTPLEFRSEHSI